VRTFRTHHHRSVLAVTALLAACGGSNNPGGGGGPDGGGNGGGNTTITGQVIDINGRPLPGRTVVQSGRSTTTDASGNFTFTTVALPYDIAILQTATTQSSPNKVATVYQQLTRTDPALTDFAATNTTNRSATLGGSLTGAFPAPTGAATAVAFGSTEASAGNYFTSNPWGFTVSWFGPTSTTGAVHALQWTIDANGTLNAVLTHGVKTGVTLTSGGSVSNADVTLTAVTTQPVTGTISVPSGHTISERAVNLQFTDGTEFPLSDDGVNSANFAVPIPSGIGASARLFAAADDGTAQVSAQLFGIAPGTSNVTLTLPSPAVPTTPASGATGVDTTTNLVWTPVPGGVTVVVLTPQGSDPFYFIVNGGTTTRIPDLSAQGVGLPSNRPYTWSVVALGPFASVDAYAVPNSVVGFQTISGSSPFTTR
jgi:hypothetical protein